MAYDVTKIVDDINELDAEMKKGVLLFEKECKKRGFDVRVFETYRPQARQNYLYEQGRTRAGKKVTWTKTSFHTTRRAIDVIHRTLFWNAPESFWKGIAEIGRSLGFNCGYYWKTQDKPHMQLDIGMKVKEPTVNGNTSKPTQSVNPDVVIPELKFKLKQMYGFSDTTIEYLCSYKFANALVEGLLIKKPLSQETKDFILKYKFGKELLHKIYNL